MNKEKTNQKRIVILLVLVLLAAALLAWMIWFLTAHFFVGGRAYPKDAKVLDLRDQKLSVADHEAIRYQVPGVEIRWDVPFQGKSWPDSTTELTVSSLSDSDLEVLQYFKELKAVDARGCLDYEQLMALRKQYPDIDLRYTVTIGGTEYAQDTAAVVCSELTDEEIAHMAYLPELKYVDASGCRDYARIGAMMAEHPEMNVSYQVELLGKTYTEADVAMTVDDPDVEMLMEKLAWLPHMESVHLVEPSADAGTLRRLMETYPRITFTWDKTVLGKTFHSAQTEYDLTGTSLIAVKKPTWANTVDVAETASILRTVEEVMAYFPNAEKVILPDCAFDNETMAAFREKMRPEYKVVWYVHITKKPVRTDQEIIHSSALKVCFIDELSQDLVYCEDAVVVDIGHSYVKNIEWVKGMPKLKYLILTHNWIKDLSPLSTCKNMVYLEIYWNDHIPDYTPLLECTSLVDLNLSGSYADLEPIKQMTWLKNLWATCRGVTQAEYNELKEALPNTYIEYRGGDYTSYGWRNVPGYFEMRDLMGLPYNHW